MDNITKALSQLQDLIPLFQGAKSMESGKLYLNIQIVTTYLDKVLLDMSSWTEIYDAKLLIATIHAEFVREIGQLIYANQFTDTISLQEQCRGNTNFEWELQLKQVSTKDKDNPWKERSEDLIVLAPA